MRPLLLDAVPFHEVTWLKNLMAVSAMLTSLGVIVLSVIKINHLCQRKIKRYGAWKERRDLESQTLRQLPEMVRQFSGEMKRLASKIDEQGALLASGINGESLVGSVRFLCEQEELRFWLQKRPAFRCDNDGRIKKVSNALCQLAHTVSEQDLFNFGWKRIAADHSELERMHRTWEDGSRPPRSPFHSEFDVVDLQGNSRGRWVLRMLPIEYRGQPSWEGAFYPVDDEAKTIAERQGFQLR